MAIYVENFAYISYGPCNISTMWLDIISHPYSPRIVLMILRYWCNHNGYVLFRLIINITKREACTQTVDLLHKSHDAPVLYPTMHTFGNKCAQACTFLSQNGALWDIYLMHCGVCEMGVLIVCGTGACISMCVPRIADRVTPFWKYWLFGNSPRTLGSSSVTAYRHGFIEQCFVHSHSEVGNSSKPKPKRRRSLDKPESKVVGIR